MLEKRAYLIQFFQTMNIRIIASNEEGITIPIDTKHHLIPTKDIEKVHDNIQPKVIALRDALLNELNK